MKKKPASQSPPVRPSPWPVRSFMRRRLVEGGFFKLRVLVAVLLCFSAITLVLFAFGKASAQPNAKSTSVIAEKHSKTATKTRSRSEEHTSELSHVSISYAITAINTLSLRDALPISVRSFMRRRLGEGGFFKLRVLVAVLLCFSAITLVLFAFGKASAQPNAKSTSVIAEKHSKTATKTRS